MKKLAIVLVCFILLLYAIPICAMARIDDPAPAFKVTQLENIEDEQFIWDTLSKYSPSEKLTAGIMGFFWRESGFKSDAIPGHQQWVTRDICKEFTETIDAGLSDGSTKEQFVTEAHNKGGYGLGQWWAFSYLEAFYDFAKEWGTSISDAEMQCAFVMWSIENQRPKVLEQFETYGTVSVAGRAMAVLYDGAPDAAEMFVDLAKIYYDRYAEQ